MKRTLFALMALFASYVSYAQMEIMDFIESVNWHDTETALIAKLFENIEPTEKYVWKDEGAESNFRFKELNVCGYPISKSYIRVKQDGRLIFRINLIVLDDEADIAKSRDLKELLTETLGKPYVSGEEKNIWLFDDCKVEATFLDLSNVLTPEVEKYTYAVSIEPMHTYYVDWTKAVVESNNAHSPIIQIEYFRTDNDHNVYIKEVDKQEMIKEKEKLLPTPKGLVVVFDGGMFCFRQKEQDIVYMKYGMATTYPIVNK